MWRLSTQLRSLEQQKKISPLPTALHMAYISALNTSTHGSTVIPPSGLFNTCKTTYPFSEGTVASGGKDIAGMVSCASVRLFQRAEAPPLSSFSVDPYRYTRDPLTEETIGSTVESTEKMDCDDNANFQNDQSIGFVRSVKDRKHCVYYKMALDLPKQLSSTPCVTLMEISPEYPVRPPQFIITSRISALSTDSSKSGGDITKPGAQIDNALKSIECEVNAGCLNFILGGQTPGVSDSGAIIAAVEDSLDATVTFQIGLLLCLVVLNSMSGSDSSAAVSEFAVSKKRGRNRRTAMLQGLYGRQPF